MQAKFNSKKFREIEEMGEYNKFAAGGLWIKFKGEDIIFNCELIDEERYAIIHSAFFEMLKNDKNKSGDDDTFEEIDEAEKAGLIKL